MSLFPCRKVLDSWKNMYIWLVTTLPNGCRLIYRQALTNIMMNNEL